MNILKIVSSFLYLTAGIITLVIGLRFLLSGEFFKYHRQASGLEWKEIKDSLQKVILAVFKMAGLGIVCLSLMILIFSVITFLGKINGIFKFAIPLISFLFWAGSLTVTFNVHRKTKADTPWKGSLFAMIIVIIAFLCSIVNP